MIDPISALTSQVEGTAATGAGTSTAAASTATGASASTATGGPSFGDVLAQVASGSVDTLRGAEAASLSALQGKGTTLEVVQAIKSAEQALQTAIAVRDKAVQAYQEISRMTI